MGEYEYRVAWGGKYPGHSVTYGDVALAKRMLRHIIHTDDRKAKPHIQRRLITTWEPVLDKGEPTDEA